VSGIHSSQLDFGMAPARRGCIAWAGALPSRWLPSWQGNAARASVKIAYSIAYFAGRVLPYGEHVRANASSAARRGRATDRSGYAVCAGPGRGGPAVRNAELGQDAGDVVHDRARADREAVADFAIGGAVSQET
jgi:hypothetical protein